ncbi:hypothetical protein AGMMS49992_09140 [Clostridia bacterium]|nr:hypothetical protein AGMMS49992_09140 [Clostridia bacterium]
MYFAFDHNLDEMDKEDFDRILKNETANSAILQAFEYIMSDYSKAKRNLRNLSVTLFNDNYRKFASASQELLIHTRMH